MSTSPGNEDASIEVAVSSRPKTPRAAKTKVIAKPSPKKRVIMKRPKKSKWNSENILTDPKSPLATADLRTVLSNPMAWEALDAQDRAEILSLFPDDQHILAAGTEDARPDFASLMNDDSFRHDCAAYVENIAQGRHDPEWLACAWAAHQRRKAGDFDDFLEERFGEEWGIDLPSVSTPERAPSADRTVVSKPEGRDATPCPVDTAVPRENNDQDPPEGREDVQMDEVEPAKDEDNPPRRDKVDELQAREHGGGDAPTSEDGHKTIVVRHATQMDIDSEDELA